MIGVEAKRTQSRSTTKSMHSALETLGLDHLYVVHAGLQRFPLTDSITAVPATEILLASTATEVLDA